MTPIKFLQIFILSVFLLANILMISYNLKCNCLFMSIKIYNSTIPSLAELDEFVSLLREVWSTGILTNNGKLLQRLEKEICNILAIDEYIAVSNGTIALQLAIDALDVKGTVLVPAFSWIATAAAVNWQKCKIRYCDIDPETLNISVDSIKNNIDSTVDAIIPVHVFGNPCDVEDLSLIAKEYNLKLIYDAAHAFGATLHGKSILTYGDISCVSTHATKIFNTAEGGGIIASSERILDKLKSYRSFGFDDKKNVITDGINAKMSEIHAALGLANLEGFNSTLNHRKRLNFVYRNELKKSGKISFQKINEGSNCSYFPIILENEETCMNILKLLADKNIFLRRYFYPALNTLSNLSRNQYCPVSESISVRILCLPTHDMVSEEDAILISSIINKFI